jgi:hypothetical protein
MNKRAPQLTFGPCYKFIVAITCSLLLSIATAGASDKGADSWILTQTQNVGGTFTIYLMPDAVKIVGKRSGAVLIARAPEWKVCLFNPTRKLFYESSLSDWARFGACSNLAPGKRLDVNKMKIKAGSHPTLICNLHCRTYEFKGTANPLKGVDGRSTFTNKLESLSIVRQFQVTNDIAYTPERELILRGMYKFAVGNAILIKQSSFYSNGQVQTELTTVDCKHQAVPDSQMQYPTDGYRKAKNVEAVAATNTQDLEQLSDSVSQLGEDTAGPKKK